MLTKSTKEKSSTATVFNPTKGLRKVTHCCSRTCFSWSCLKMQSQIMQHASSKDVTNSLKHKMFSVAAGWWAQNASSWDTTKSAKAKCFQLRQGRRTHWQPDHWRPPFPESVRTNVGSNLPLFSSKGDLVSQLVPTSLFSIVMIIYIL